MAANGKFSTDEVIKAIHDKKGMVYHVARFLGCSPQTVYNYAKRYKSVQSAIDEERGIFLDDTEVKLDQAVQKGEGWAIAFALRTLGKHRGYTEKQLIEQQSTNIEIDLNTLTDEQIKRLANGENIAAILADNG